MLGSTGGRPARFGYAGGYFTVSPAQRAAADAFVPAHGIDHMAILLDTELVVEWWSAGHRSMRARRGAGLVASRAVTFDHTAAYRKS